MKIDYTIGEEEMLQAVSMAIEMGADKIAEDKKSNLFKEIYVISFFIGVLGLAAAVGLSYEVLGNWGFILFLPFVLAFISNRQMLKASINKTKKESLSTIKYPLKVELEVSDQWLSTDVGDIKLSLKWNMITKIKIIGENLVIIPKNYTPIFIPKSAFENSNEEVEFVKFIEEKTKS